MLPGRCHDLPPSHSPSIKAKENMILITPDNPDNMFRVNTSQAIIQYCMSKFKMNINDI